MGMTTNQMIELAKSKKPNKLNDLTPTQLDQFMRFMFGDEFIDSPDYTKGKIREYLER